LCKPITRSILDYLIIPSLPSSFGLLPSFLELLKHAVAFEDKFIVGVLQGNGHDRAIKAWSDGVCGHYERHRRVEILEGARSMAIDSIDFADTFQGEIILVPESPPPIVNQTDDDFERDAWGFEDEESEEPEGTGALKDVENSWGFDEDVEPDVEESANSEPLLTPDALPAETGHMNGDEPDPADAWGWNDEESLPPEEENAWDPWSDPLTSSELPDPPKSTPVSAPPKAATRLEKQASKHKKPLNGNSFTNSPPMPSATPPPPPQHAFPPTSELQKPVKPPMPHVAPKHQTPNHAKPPIPKETYIVSNRLKRLVRRVEDVINEGKQFAASSLFSTSQGSSPPGTILFQSASSILELYQALYPVKFRKEVDSPERSMQYSNDCFYLSEKIGQLEKEATGQPLLMERLNECSRHLKVLSDSWFYATIVSVILLRSAVLPLTSTFSENRHCQALDEVLVKGAQAFTYTGEQDRYDECETAVNDTMRNVKQLASKLQVFSC
jgi:centromere/kinetochore protein ZW10